METKTAARYGKIILKGEIFMREYDVMITETLQRKITVEADSKEEAKQIVADGWDHQDYVLGASDFTSVYFDTVSEREIPNIENITVLLVQPGKIPEVITIENELETLRKVVNGDIEVTYPFDDDEVGIILNEEGKLRKLPANRAIYTEDGDISDIYVGDFLVVGLDEDDFCSLSSELLDKYEEIFHNPEVFIKMAHGFISVPLTDDMLKENKEKPFKPQAKQKQSYEMESI